ncbi:nuclease-related domain-containing DEAD/DEAH box helicase [Massilia sp. LC238]|uniref:nuclease-related domain-containing DEAD/DEAH box helicase n=1 Tax=Massilia sp. LC238 TaxID=1502852 RepID=UPI0004E2C100|nr:nuclease-related domain-containing DEAD/DEAH box helicase [Massilia sp. LC238]KFC76348.1 hypothetical protein FG94_00445 [Massilia sp. LC238]
MATLIPDTPKECPFGERLVYEKLGRDLDDDTVILHSLGLPGHPTKIWGEADIVVLSTKGFFALEVKGGKVSCRGGIWYFGEPGSAGYTKREDPWTQAKGTMFGIRQKLCGADRERFEGLLTGFGVVMPMETFTATGAEIEPAVLLDRRDFRRNLGFYIGDLQRHWTAAYVEKHQRQPRLPDREDIRRARAVLRPDIDSAFSLGSYLNGVERELLQLSNSQIRASRRMAANPRTVVTGKAGTGKTIIAIERARQCAKAGQRVLFLCFNQLLARHVRTSLSDDPDTAGIEIRHLHSVYREVIERAGLSGKLDQFAGGRRELYGTVFPELFVEAYIQAGGPAYDVLVVDEAQDVLTAENLDAFDVLLAKGLNRGSWHIFLDPLQNLYNASTQDLVEKRLAEAQPTHDNLFENCRNSRQVAVQASIVSGIDLAIEGAPDGPECDNIYYHDRKSFIARLEDEVRTLVSRDVRPEDIVILSTRRRENSLLAGTGSVAGIPLVDISEGASGALHFSTMHAFKGLERLVVIAVGMEEIGQAEHSMLHYAGLSRARAILKTFLPENARAKYGDQVLMFSQRYRSL